MQPEEVVRSSFHFQKKGGEIVNAKQQRFADEYLIDLNATQAAIRAGYSAKTANRTGPRLLSNVVISEYIQAKLEEIHNQKTADAQEVIEYLSSVMRGEHQDQVLKLVGDGVQVVTNIKVSAKDRIRAAELIGKRFGMFTDKTDLTVSQPIVISGGDKLED